MAQLSEIRVAFSADPTAFVNALKRVQDASKTMADKVKSKMDSVSAATSMLRGAVVALAASATIRKVIDLTASIDDMADFAVATDISTTALQELAYAGSFIGATMEDFQTILSRVAKTASEAAQGEDKASDAFKELGVSVTDAKGNFKATDVILMEVLESLSKIPAAADRLRVATDVAGKEGAKSLNKMAVIGIDGIQKLRDEAQRLGIVLDESMIQKASETDDMITKLAFTMDQQLKKAVADNADSIQDLAAAWGTAMPQMISWTVALGRGMQEVGTWIGETIAKIAGAETTIDKIKNVRIQRASLENQRYNPSVRLMMGGDYEKKIGLLDAEERKLMQFYAETEGTKSPPPKTEAKPTPRTPNAPRPKKDKSSKKTKKEDMSFEDLEIKRMKEVFGLLEHSNSALNTEDEARITLLDSLKVRYEGNAEAIRMVTEAQEKLREEIEKRNGWKEINEDLAEGINGWGEYAKKMKLAADEIRDFTNLTPEILTMRDKLVEAAKLVEQGFITGTEFNEYFRKLTEDTKDSEEMIKDLGMTFVSAFEDAIVEGKKLSDVLKALEQDIIKIITRTMVTNPLSEWLQGAAQGMMKGGGSGGGGGGGMLGSIIGGTSGSGGILGSIGDMVVGMFGAAKGAAFSGGNVVPFASGGMVLSPTLFGMGGGKTGVMGEAGPEAILPLTRGKGGKLGVTVSGGKAGSQPIINMTNNISISTPTNTISKQSISQVQAGIARSVNRASRRQS